MNQRLRPATGGDVGAVHALEVLVFGADAWSRASVAEELTGPRRRALVASGHPLAGYVVTAAAGDVLDLQRVAVHPAYRRRGVARALLAAALDDPGPGVARVLLEVAVENAAAVALYRQVGFVEVSRRRAYYREGGDALVMAREVGETGVRAPGVPT